MPLTSVFEESFDEKKNGRRPKRRSPPLLLLLKYVDANLF
jgi:hypothetical protein